MMADIHIVIDLESSLHGLLPEQKKITFDRLYDETIFLQNPLDSILRPPNKKPAKAGRRKRKL